MVVVLVAIGALAYDVEVPGGTLPGALLSLVVGVVALSALGFAFTAAIPSENAAAPMANAIVLPLYFISGIFIPEDELPGAMQTIGAIFPVQR